MADLDLAAAELVDRIESAMGYESPTAAQSAWCLARLNDGYRRFLRGHGPKSGRNHVWSFLEPVTTLSLLAEADVTCTGTYSATTELTTITADADSFFQHIVGHIIEVDDDDVGDLVVYGYTSVTVLTVSGDHSWTGNNEVTYPLSQIHDMPAGFGGLIRKPEYFNTPPSTSMPLLTEVSHQAIMERHLRGIERADPDIFAIVPMVFTAATGQRWQMWFAPLMEYDRVVSYRYRLKGTALTDSATDFPVGGPNFVDTILQAAMASMEARAETGQAAGRAEALYRDLMEEALDADGAQYATQDEVTQLQDEHTGISA